jgi:hypothetical protein
MSELIWLIQDNFLADWCKVNLNKLLIFILRASCTNLTKQTYTIDVKLATTKSALAFDTVAQW